MNEHWIGSTASSAAYRTVGDKVYLIDLMLFGTQHFMQCLQILPSTILDPGERRESEGHSTPLLSTYKCHSWMALQSAVASHFISS